MTQITRESVKVVHDVIDEPARDMPLRFRLSTQLESPRHRMHVSTVGLLMLEDGTVMPIGTNLRPHSDGMRYYECMVATDDAVYDFPETYEGVPMIETHDETSDAQATALHHDVVEWGIGELVRLEQAHG